MLISHLLLATLGHVTWENQWHLASLMSDLRGKSDLKVHFLSQSYFFLLQKAVHATSSTLTSMVFFEPCTFILWKKQLVSWNKRKESSFISAWEWGNYWNFISGWTIPLCLLFLQLVINCMGINKKCNYWCCVTVLPRSMGSASPLRYIVY